MSVRSSENMARVVRLSVRMAGHATRPSGSRSRRELSKRNGSCAICRESSHLLIGDPVECQPSSRPYFKFQILPYRPWPSRFSNFTQFTLGMLVLWCVILVYFIPLFPLLWFSCFLTF